MDKNRGKIQPIVLVLMAALGVVLFLFVSSSAPIKDQLFSVIFPKDSSNAQTE